MNYVNKDRCFNARIEGLSETKEISTGTVFMRKMWSVDKAFHNKGGILAIAMIEKNIAFAGHGRAETPVVKYIPYEGNENRANSCLMRV